MKKANKKISQSFIKRFSRVMIKKKREQSVTSVLSLFLLETRVYLLDLLNNVLFALFAHKEHHQSIVASIATDEAVDIAEFDGRK